VGKKVTDLHQDLIGEIDLEFIDNSTDADVLFLALPHKESKIWLENNNVGNAVVIDLGNDFRIGETYQGNSFVYGLPELNLDQLKEQNSLLILVVLLLQFSWELSRFFKLKKFQKFILQELQAQLVQENHFLKLRISVGDKIIFRRIKL
jgi:hypothetical protein